MALPTRRLKQRKDLKPCDPKLVLVKNNFFSQLGYVL